VRSRRVTIAIAAAAVIACCCGDAQGFRPFGGIDAAVAETGTADLECWTVTTIEILLSQACRT
jgi:hypothetical protein